MSRLSIISACFVLANMMYAAFLTSWTAAPWWAKGIAGVLAVLGSAGPALLKGEPPVTK